ncbi:glycine--tRNA ligase [Candidatus Wolfebacteria bacterium]|nr:MAG: glycine--tRNA ligase [Candidatus Wolfebacteria bacterium]
MINNIDNNLLDKIVSLAKRRGFVYQGSEIYGGLAGTWDYGPLGVALKNNIKHSWWNKFVDSREDMYGLDSAILMNQRVWETSGHVGGFNDPLVEDLKTNKRYRADHLLEDGGVDVTNMSAEDMDAHIKEKKVLSPDGNPLGDVKQFNMMLKTEMGAVQDSASISYLRPETAQGIFVNFKNIVDSFHPKLPFGIAQIGKAFRNEITPRDFIFRVREFEQMEIEYFVRESDWEKHFEYFKDEMLEWMDEIGLDMNKVHDVEIGDGDRAHYSKRTVDFEFEYPFGQKELYGLAYRTNYDLTKHDEATGAKLGYLDQETNERFIPHVIEPSLGVDRTVLALLLSAYTEDEMGGETRVFLKFKPSIAPYKVAVFPLLKNKPELIEKAREVYGKIKAEIPQTLWDDNGNIGKRYRRQDEIGTPLCVTVDFDSLEDDTVTLRDRDTGKQERIALDTITDHIKKIVSGS